MAYRKVTKSCPQCSTSFTGHPNKRFCNLRCKDRFHNTHNPRGIQAEAASFARFVDPYSDEIVDDDAHPFSDDAVQGGF